MSAELVDVGKRFGDEWVLEEVSLDVQPGEIVALVGISGAGKSTTLKIIGGVEQPTKGKVLLAGRDVTKARPWQRQAAMVFESYILYPHLSVSDNIGFPLRAPMVRKRYPEAEVQRRIKEVATICEIDQLLDRKPVALSGGQRQRVALSRALARDPSVYLMDEPIAHLDAKLRHWLRGALRRWFTAREVPVLWATPDGLEAMAIADRIAILHDGRIAQEGTPRALFHEPETMAVARLLGDPAINIFDAVVDDGGLVRIEGVGDRPLRIEHPDGRAAVNGQIKVGVRPTALQLGSESSPAALPGEVIGIELGSREAIVIVELEGTVTKIVMAGKDLPTIGDRVWIDWAGARAHVFSLDGLTQYSGSVNGRLESSNQSTHRRGGPDLYVRSK